MVVSQTCVLQVGLLPAGPAMVRAARGPWHRREEHALALALPRAGVRLAVRPGTLQLRARAAAEAGAAAAGALQAAPGCCSLGPSEGRRWLRSTSQLSKRCGAVRLQPCVQ